MNKMKKNDMGYLNSIVFLIVIELVLILFFSKDTGMLKKDFGKDISSIQEVYIDNDKISTIQEIINGDYDSVFESYINSDASSSLSDANYWIKIDLDSIKDNQEYTILEIQKPHLGLVDFYHVSKSNEIVKTVHTGRNLPFESRELDVTNFVFLLDDGHLDGVIYLKINTDSYLQVPSVLWNDVSFISALDVKGIAYGFFYGALLVMIVYNSFLAISLKDTSYLLYVLFVISFTLLQLVWDGYSFQYLWPNSGKWDLLANPFFINLSILCLTVFNYLFLEINKRDKKLYLIYKIFSAAVLLSILLVFIIKVKYSIYISMLSSCFVIILSLISLFIKKENRRSHVIYLLGWSTIFTTNIISVLAGLKILPYNNFTLYAPKYGVLLLVILFSIALSDRIKTSEKLTEKEKEKGNLLRNLHEMNIRIGATRELQEIISTMFLEYKTISEYESLIVLIEKTEARNNFDLYEKGNESPKHVEFNSDEYIDYCNSFNTAKYDNENIFIDKIQMMEKCASYFIIPLCSFEKKIGLIILFSNEETKISEDEEFALVDFANQIALTLDNISLLKKYTHAAERDNLTDLYNRNALFSRANKVFNKVTKNNHHIAAIMIDIDDFKSINDTYGHAAGDTILKDVASRMLKQVANKGTIGRYGGEEFLVFIEDSTKEEILVIANSIRTVIDLMTFKLDSGKSISITISVGVAYKTRFTQSFYKLTEAADRALYTAKNTGKNRVVEEEFIC